MWCARPLLLLTPSDASKIFCGQHEKQISPPRRLLMRSAVLGHEQVKHSLSATARICATCAAAPHEKSTSILSQTDTTRYRGGQITVLHETLFFTY
jgi:hypothetical protein